MKLFYFHKNFIDIKNVNLWNRASKNVHNHTFIVYLESKIWRTRKGRNLDWHINPSSSFQLFKTGIFRHARLQFRFSILWNKYTYSNILVAQSLKVLLINKIFTSITYTMFTMYYNYKDEINSQQYLQSTWASIQIHV